MGDALTVWEQFLRIPNIGEKLSVLDISLTLIGFSITVFATLRAKKSAEMARDAANMAANSARRLDLFFEISSLIRQLEELKRLHRANVTDLLSERYSSVRVKAVEIRESGLLKSPLDQSALQDVISRVVALEKDLDKNLDVLTDKKRVAKFNESVSICSDAIVGIKERLRMNITVQS